MARTSCARGERSLPLGYGAMPCHVLILRQSEPYPYGWVRNQGRALAGAGYAVTVVGPTGFGNEASDEMIDGVRALRFRRTAGGRGLRGYVREYAVSAWHMARLAFRAHRDRPVDVVIASAPPDFLVWLALPFKLAGAGIIYDQRDPAPELFEAKFGRRGWLYRILVRFERSAWRRADVAMPHNESCADLGRDRGGISDERMYIVGVGPDPERIFPVEEQPELRRGKRFLVLWIGAISQQESLGVFVDAIEILVRDRSRTDISFSIAGPGDEREAILEDVRRRGLHNAVDLPGVITDDDLLRSYMATADICVSVDEQNDMNDKSTMMKVLEYMAMGRAVIQTSLHEMKRISADTTLYTRSGDALDLANQIERLLGDEELREQLGDAARARMVEGLMWSDQVAVMIEAVEAARR